MDLEIGMFHCLVATEEERLGIQPGDKKYFTLNIEAIKTSFSTCIAKSAKLVRYIMCQATP